MSYSIGLRPGVIGDYCKAEDITRAELARRMGVGEVTAYRVDSGQVSPSTKFIAGLIRVTGQPFESLFEVAERAA